eukprot:6259-Heterococcus_DN1.PRE.2
MPDVESPPPLSVHRRVSSRVTEELLDVNTRYLIDDKELGHGHYGVVRKCVCRETNEEFAIKTIKKGKVRPRRGADVFVCSFRAIASAAHCSVGRLELLKREIDILRTVNHPSIIKLVDVYEDANNLHLVTELCTGGELFDSPSSEFQRTSICCKLQYFLHIWIIAKTESDEGHYSERDAARLVHKMLSAIDYIHTEHNICHRDLKPENFLFKSIDSDDQLKIIDFGLSRFEDQSTHMTTRVGTPYYIAPEVLSRNYDKRYSKLYKKVHSDSYHQNGILSAHAAAPYAQSMIHTVHTLVYNAHVHNSAEAKDLIEKLLQKDPKKRITASNALVHEWFDKVMDGADTAANIHVNVQRMHHRLKRCSSFIIIAVTMHALKHCTAITDAAYAHLLLTSVAQFVGANKMKKMALNIIAGNVAEEDIGHLRKLFHSIDIDGNGVITLEELQKVVASEGLIELQSEVLAVMQGIDMDGSQTLDWREFLAASLDRTVFLKETYIRQAFDHFDPAKKGHISVEDLMRCFGSDEEARKILGELDFDGNGVITFEGEIIVR